jgi:hypothetical protein
VQLDPNPDLIDFQHERFGLVSAAMWPLTIAPFFSISSSSAGMAGNIAQRNVSSACPHVNRRNTLQEHWHSGRG